MEFAPLFTFLEKLQRNNNKLWMDQNRSEYQSLRKQFVQWLDKLNLRVAELDPEYYNTPGKRGINRINNNLMFHPEKPVYKDHFGAGLDKAPGTGDFYIQIGVESSMLAGGLWRPPSKTLASIREAIDYNGDELVNIIRKKSFVEVFGDLYEDERLKTAPKGYHSDHPHIELLKNKSFAVAHMLDRAQILDPGFEDYIIAVYMEMLPFRRYLNHAITV